MENKSERLGDSRTRARDGGVENKSERLGEWRTRAKNEGVENKSERLGSQEQERWMGSGEQE